MDKDSVEGAFSISPEVLGTLTWDEGGTILTFTPKNLSLATEYVVTFQSGIKSLIGGVILENITHTFNTVGNVYVTNISPASNAKDVDVNANISVTFDQPIDQTSANSRFSISPSINGTFSWSGNTVTFNPTSALTYDTNYQVTIGSGVKSIYGYDSNRNFTYNFSTKPQLILLDIAWDGQDTAWTCNFAATKMALTAKGVYISETDLINIAGIEPAFNFSTMSGGNPHKGFVNNYGTYWEPISKAVNSYRSNMVKSGWTLSEVCSEISKGNPIVTWGQNGWSSDIARNWTAPDGEYITGFSGMHSVVIRGCLGNLNNPSHIYIQDPWRKWGSELTASEFLRRWSYFNYTGMVIY